jgi:hypothetical protein
MTIRWHKYINQNALESAWVNTYQVTYNRQAFDEPVYIFFDFYLTQSIGKPMQTKHALKSLFIVAVMTLGAGSVSAKDSKSSFEDGLKNSWSTPVQSISLNSKDDGRFDRYDRFELFALFERFERFEHYINRNHHFDMSWHHHNGSGGGIDVSPVSEPATDAMLLSGLVMLLALARRKSQSRGA